jgi:hypothetical protein
VCPDSKNQDEEKEGWTMISGKLLKKQSICAFAR